MPSRDFSLFIAVAIATHAAAFDTVINIPPATSLAGLQSNTQVNVLDGANLSGFQIPGSLTGIEVNILGGTIQQDVIVNGLNQLNIAGGSIGDGVAGRSIHVTGGEMFALEASHNLSIGGGSIQRLTLSESTLSSDIYGGNIDRVGADNGATTTIRGGRVGLLTAEASATTTLRGGDFRLNGQPVAGPLLPAPYSVLTGVYEDGSSFVYALPNSAIQLGDTLAGVSLNVVAVPAASVVIDLAVDPVPNGLRAGQTLLASAGDDLGDNFHANGATIELGAGALGERAKLLNTRLTIDGGAVGRDLLVYTGSQIDLRSGSIASFLSAPTSPNPAGGAPRLHMTGGTIGADLPSSADHLGANWMRITLEGGAIVHPMALNNSFLYQAGGLVSDVDINVGSRYDLYGGVAEDVRLGGGSLTMDGGAIRRLQVVGGHANIEGGRLGSLSGAAQLAGQFELDGVPVSGQTTVPSGSVLTGVLVDGSTLALSPMFGDALGTLSLASAPVPPSTPAVINAPFDPVPNGVRDGQLLTLAPGADAGHDFVALGAILNVAGGAVGDAAVVVGGTTLLSAGSIGKQFTAIDDAVVVVSGGVLGPASTGGPIDLANVLRGSSLSVVGGAVTSRVVVGSGSSVDALGGVVYQIRPLGGSAVQVAANSQITSIANNSTGSDFGTGRVSLSINGGVTASVSVQRTDLVLTSGQAGSVSVSENSTAIVSGGAMDWLTAGVDSTMVMTGGAVGESLSANSEQSSKPSLVQFQGGVVDSLFAIGAGGRVEMEGGDVVDKVVVNGGHMEIRSGTVQNADSLAGYSTPNLVGSRGVLEQSGGQIRAGVDVRGQNQGTEGAVFEVFGGVFGRRNRSTAGSSVRLQGAEFRLNGLPVSGPINPTGDYVLMGTLADGTVMILSSATDDMFAAGTLEIVASPIPAAPIIINSPDAPAPRGLRAGQTLNLGEGVAIGYHFTAVEATLNMNGGSIGYGMELLGSQANLNGGTVGDGLFVHPGSTVNIAGGAVGDEAQIQAGAGVNLSAGRLGNFAQFEAGSNFVMLGGATGTSTRVRGDAVISGGVVGRGLNMQIGSSLELRGGEFRLNGVPVSGSTTFSSGDLLTGVLSDGTPVLFNSADILRTFIITETPIPDAPLTTIVSPALPTPRGLRAGQSLVLQPGAATVDDFTSVGANLRLDGGQVGARLEAYDSRLDLRNGTIGSSTVLLGDTTLTVRGGSVGDNLGIGSGATFSQTGGSVGLVIMTTGATVNVAGGDFQGQPTNSIGHDTWAPAGSAINLFGLSFKQAGVDLLADIGLGESVVVTNKRAALDGVLADGSDFTLTTGGRGQSIAGATITLTKLLLGDFNYDGVVNAADYTVWRDSEGLEVAAGPGADHDFDGVITATDREVWATNYGRIIPAVASLSVPEPTAAGIVMLAVLLGSTRVSRQPQNRTLP
jgi:hypothetical protein